MAYNSTPILVAVLIMASLALGAGLQFIVNQNSTTVSMVTVTNTTTSSSGNSSAPYILTLVITTGNEFNSTIGDQPAYFVLGPNGLESSANITLPANRLIEVEITNYDEGSSNISSAQYTNVMGTISGKEDVYNNTAINSTEGPNGIELNGTLVVSSLPLTEITHTFTVPGLGLNMPVASESTIVGYFMTGAPGDYLWLCESACGSGATGQGGAMVTPGWMTGTLTVG